MAVAVGQLGVEPRDAAAVICGALVRGGTRLHPLDEIVDSLI